MIPDYFNPDNHPRHEIVGIIAERIGTEPERIDSSRMSLSGLGFSSPDAWMLLGDLEEQFTFRQKLSADKLYRKPLDSFIDLAVVPDSDIARDQNISPLHFVLSNIP